MRVPDDTDARANGRSRELRVFEFQLPELQSLVVDEPPQLVLRPGELLAAKLDGPSGASSALLEPGELQFGPRESRSVEPAAAPGTRPIFRQFPDAPEPLLDIPDAVGGLLGQPGAIIAVSLVLARAPLPFPGGRQVGEEMHALPVSQLSAGRDESSGRGQASARVPHRGLRQGLWEDVAPEGPS